jgi:hypothetical protein
MPTKTNPIVPPHLALEIEAGGESVPQWLERMEGRIAALTQVKLEAGCPPDLEARAGGLTYLTFRRFNARERANLLTRTCCSA